MTTVLCSRRDAPLVALVGRPNVGKSTLFNRFIGRRTAAVFDEPGVTRDRIFGETVANGCILRFVDTGGLDLDAKDTITAGVRAHAELAMGEADYVLLVVDAFVGLTPEDSEVAGMVRRCGKPAAVVVNKVDTAARDHHVADFYALGFEFVYAVSAEHGRGVGDLEDILFKILDPPADDRDSDLCGPLAVRDEEPPAAKKTQVEWDGAAVRVAVVGRPNAGKSSLVNHLLGDSRHLATPEAGTTRDPIDSFLSHDGVNYLFIDTAGIRRKRSIVGRIEQFAVSGAFNSMDRADVVLLVLDGVERPSDQDARIASMANEKGKALVLVVNKWDLVENPEWRERYMAALRLQIPFADYANIVRLSAKTGRGTRQLYAAVVDAQRERHRRVGTGELNRFFRQVVESHPPPIRGGKRPQLYFVSQPLVRPPTFIFTTRRASDLHFSYVRYLQNSLRKRYGFQGTPIWLKFRPRKDRHA